MGIGKPFIANFAAEEIKRGNILATLIDDADFEWLIIDVFFSILEITRVFYHVFIQSCIIIVLGASKTIRFQLKKNALD